MKKEKWSVYKHITPNGKVYIGITHQKPKYRWGRDGNGYKSNHHFYNAIKKYGWENITHEIIAKFETQEEAETIERQLIDKYKAADRKYGYNKALGGHALSIESRRKIGDTRKQRGIKSWTFGKHLSETTKKRISEALTGKHHTISEQGKKNIADAKRGSKNPNYGKAMSQEKKRHLIEINEKPVYKIVGNKKERFRSVKEAGNKTGIFSGNISRVCKGQRKTAGGFKWEYA